MCYRLQHITDNKHEPNLNKINFNNSPILSLMQSLTYKLVRPIGLTSARQVFVKLVQAYRSQWHSSSIIYQLFIKHTLSIYISWLNECSMCVWWMLSKQGLWLVLKLDRANKCSDEKLFPQFCATFYLTTFSLEKISKNGFRSSQLLLLLSYAAVTLSILQTVTHGGAMCYDRWNGWGKHQALILTEGKL